MEDFENSQDIDFTVDQNNLYREESITDLKVASIRRLIPVKADGSDDPGRAPLFFGHTHLVTPDGPLPVQSRLMANSLNEAYEVFPDTMKKALDEMMTRLQQMQRQRETKKQNDSRIIVPKR